MTTTETPPAHSVETAKRTYVPWVSLAFSATAMLVFVGLYFLHPKQVERVRTVTQILTNTVTNTVTQFITNEVVREVPKEVVKTVSAPIPTDYIWAATAFTNILFASFVDPHQVLFGMKDVRVVCNLEDPLTQVVSEDEVRARFELVLRRNNVPINSQSSCILIVELNGFFVGGAPEGLLCHNIRCKMDESQWLLRGNNWHQGIVTIWSKGYYGTVGKQTANQTLLQDAEKCAEIFANDYLSANPKAR